MSDFSNNSASTIDQTRLALCLLPLRSSNALYPTKSLTGLCGQQTSTMDSGDSLFVVRRYTRMISELMFIVTGCNIAFHSRRERCRGTSRNPMKALISGRISLTGLRMLSNSVDRLGIWHVNGLLSFKWQSYLPSCSHGSFQE